MYSPCPPPRSEIPILNTVTSRQRGLQKSSVPKSPSVLDASIPFPATRCRCVPRINLDEEGLGLLRKKRPLSPHRRSPWRNIFPPPCSTHQANQARFEVVDFETLLDSFEAAGCPSRSRFLRPGIARRSKISETLPTPDYSNEVGLWQGFPEGLA